MRVTHGDYVVLETNDIISFVPDDGSVDYRFVSGTPLLPSIPGPSTSRATMMSPTNASGIALKKLKVETDCSPGLKSRLKIQGQLLQVLEDDLNCVICSGVLIEVSSDFHSGVVKFAAAFNIKL